MNASPSFPSIIARFRCPRDAFLESPVKRQHLLWVCYHQMGPWAGLWDIALIVN